MTHSKDAENYLSVNFIGRGEVMKENQDPLVQQLERFWATENFEVNTESEPCMSVEDEKALKIMQQSVSETRRRTLPSSITLDRVPRIILTLQQIHGRTETSKTENKIFAKWRLVPELQDHYGKVPCRRSCKKGIT